RRLGDPEAPFPGFDGSRFQLADPPSLPSWGDVEVRTDADDRLRHARGQGLPDVLRLRAGSLPAAPDAVAYPQNDDQLGSLLETASASGVRVIPWGGGTSVTGGVNPVPDPRPTLTVDLGRLSGLETLDEESGLATFGAGTSGPEVERALRPRGLTLGHFPQSFELSTVGGWVATHSSGQESFGYGRIGDLVAGLDAVAPTGRLHIPALPASAAGPDLRAFMTGSEGRLGVISRAVLRVTPSPETMRVEAALARDFTSGIEICRRLVRAGAGLSMLRLSDGPETEVALTVGLAKSAFEPLLRGWLRLRGVERGCLLLFGANGSAGDVDGAFEDARRFAGEGRAVWLGAGPGKNWRRDRFHHPYLRDGLLDAGYATDTFETAAPWSKVGEVYGAVRGALLGAVEGPEREIPLLCHLSHPYADGVSLYFTFFFRCPPDPDAAVERWAGLKRRAQDAVASVGAATSHHHGVGSWHAPWAPREWGETGTRLIRAVAKELDPAGVLNPHVLLDPADRLDI
ncbi:MAG: FAD-binding oxidoreductase, partial [Acidobacteriota bacterium]